MTTRTLGFSSRTVVPALGLFVLATIWFGGLIRPIATGPLAFDAAASVLYFDRIASGQRLEAFVNTTPKPLLTAVYGVGYAITRDWRWISIAAILVAALGVVLAARLGNRVAGAAGAIAAGLVLAGESSLITEVSWAHGLPWAVTCWLATGLALTTVRPRYVLAGLAMLLGALARPETFLLLGVASLALGAIAIRGRAKREQAWLLIGWLAVPIIAIHDVLLTGDAMYSLHVAGIYATGINVRGPREVAGQVLGTLTQHPLVTIAATIGFVSLVRSPAGRLVAVGLATIGAGTGALLVVLAARGYATLNYYRHPIEVALALTAAFGFAAIGGLGTSALRSGLVGRRRSDVDERPSDGGDRARQPNRTAAIDRAALVTAVLVAILTVIVLAPVLVSGGTVDAIGIQRQIARDADRATATLARLVRERAIGPAPSTDPHLSPDPAGYRILVSRPLQTRVAVTLGLPVTVIGPLAPDHPTAGLVHRDLIVVRERLAEGSGGIQKSFKGSSPIVVEGIRFVPVEADPAHGRWIWVSDDG